ncbi:MAG: OprO/OprP family phosphate-selective porin [Cryomorphaceae bacterium]|nr:OprO/OprP family phosphate-selective porin [Cryomorphaceae bacterium]
MLKKHWKGIIVLFLSFNALVCQASEPPKGTRASEGGADSLTSINFDHFNWFEKLSIRGYTQVRYNRLFETNPDLMCEQCDRSWGRNGGFSFRRIRLIFFGNVHPRVFVYIQPDFASTIGGSGNVAQIRDAYFDLALNESKTYRLRIGQSKVPFGFENLQSSQNRIPLDRNDGMNSAVANERDLGVFFYWAPVEIRKRFADLVASNLKGSGDYGVFGLGVYNGHTANQMERNESPHLVARATYPFKFNNGQMIETSLQAYHGKFVVNRTSPQLNPGRREFTENRAAATFVLYPQPFGMVMEYNVGVGPEYNPETNSIESQPLNGGFMQAHYYVEHKKYGLFIPFVRWHQYNGGKKHELDARRHIVDEQEIGVEWQPHRNFELVVMYTFSDRTFEDAMLPMNRQRGRLLRIQAQVNF